MIFARLSTGPDHAKRSAVFHYAQMTAACLPDKKKEPRLRLSGPDRQVFTVIVEDGA